MSDEQTKEDGEDLKMIDAMIEVLCKQLELDCVQVFATKHINDKEGTLRYTRGSGNYYSRFGVVKQWCDAQFLNVPTPKDDDNEE